MKQINVMIAGAGGNNSWLLRAIYDLIGKNQIPDSVEFTIYDGDSIEQKNLLYQDFKMDEVLDNKAKVLGKRYAMKAVAKYVKSPKDFDGFDVVICGVDNKDFREMLYRYMDEHPEKYWIDLRAEGRMVAVYAKSDNVPLSTLIDALPKGESEDTSCQLSYELDNGIIQLGNRIAAIIGAQYLLNYIRGEANPPSFIHMF